MSKTKSNVAADLDTPTDLPQEAVDKISAALNVLLADTFALYLKTKNFHWHVSGRHFRDYHLMLDEQADADLRDHRRHRPSASARSAAPRCARSARSPSCRPSKDNDESFVPPREMLRELMNDNKHVAAAMRKAHEIADEHEDVGDRRACSRTSSTRPNAGPGSCSKPAATKAATRLNERVGLSLR